MLAVSFSMGVKWLSLCEMGVCESGKGLEVLSVPSHPSCPAVTTEKRKANELNPAVHP